MNKVILTNNEAQPKLKAGVDKIANAVKSTLGPRGRNVIIHHENGGIAVTKDGVTVASQIFLEDPVENIGAQMVKQVAQKTVNTCGDGTTTSCVLAQSIYSQGIYAVQNGANAMELKKGMDLAVTEVVKSLKKFTRPVEDNATIRTVGTISANGDEEIGAMIADAMDKVGKDGIITVEESRVTKSSTEIVKGIQFDRGLLSPHFITNPAKVLCEYDDCFVLIYDQRITMVEGILPIIQAVSSQQRPLLIIADEVDGEALATMVVNKLKGILKIVPVNAPGFGEPRARYLEDIALLTGGTVITENQGLKIENATLAQLGRAQKVTVGKDTTTIVSDRGNKELIDERIATIKAQLEQTQLPPEQEYYKKRIAKLTGGIAQMKIGGISELEVREKRDRIDDALHATRAAVEEGIVPGGGVALLRCMIELNDYVLREKFSHQDQIIGVNIIKAALLSPIVTILENSGFEGPGLADIIKIVEGESFDYGYNARTEKYEFFFESGVIDPAKVVRLCIENATSIASLLLTSQTVIYPIVEKWQISEMPAQMQREFLNARNQ